MKKVIMALVASVTIAGCTTAERTAVGGAAIGTAVGAVATGEVEGALAGAAIGGAAGYLIGKAADRPGYCVYRDRYGRRYTARC